MFPQASLTRGTLDDAQRQSKFAADILTLDEPLDYSAEWDRLVQAQDSISHLPMCTAFFESSEMQEQFESIQELLGLVPFLCLLQRCHLRKLVP